MERIFFSQSTYVSSTHTYQDGDGGLITRNGMTPTRVGLRSTISVECVNQSSFFLRLWTKFDRLHVTEPIKPIFPPIAGLVNHSMRSFFKDNDVVTGFPARPYRRRCPRTSLFIHVFRAAPRFRNRSPSWLCVFTDDHDSICILHTNLVITARQQVT